MNTLSQAIGWTVVHFLWQGALIAAAVGVTLGLMRQRSAQARYLVCCVALALALVVPAATLWILLGSAASPGLELRGALEAAAGPAARDTLDALMPWIAALWLSGASVLQCRTWLLWLRALRIKRRGVRNLPPHWREHVEDLCRRVGVRQVVRVLESTRVEVPMLIGWISPVILVPASALTGLTTHQLRAVLAHELAHVRRHDALVNLIQAFAESLLFFHPAVWWISDRMRVEREYCCDDVAVAVGGDMLGYARALSTLENLRALPGAAVASNGGSLMNRIFRLAGSRPSDPSRHGAGWTASVLGATLLAALALGFGVADSPVSQASEPASEPPRRAATEPETPADDREPTTEERLAAERAELERLREEEWRKREARDRQRQVEELQRELERRRAAGLAELEEQRRHVERLERGLRDDSKVSDAEAEAEARRMAAMIERELRSRQRELERSLAAQERELERLDAEGSMRSERQRAEARRVVEQLRQELEAEQRALEQARVAEEMELRRGLDAEQQALQEQHAAEVLRLQKALQLEREARERALAEEMDAERRYLEQMERGLVEEHAQRDRELAAEEQQLLRRHRLEREARERGLSDLEAEELFELERRIEQLESDDRAASDERAEVLRQRLDRLRARESDDARTDPGERARGDRAEAPRSRARLRLERERQEREKAIQELHRKLEAEQRRLEETLKRLQELEQDKIF